MSKIYFQKCQKRQKYIFKNVKNIFSKMSKKYIFKNVKNIFSKINWIQLDFKCKDNIQLSSLAMHNSIFNQSGRC